AVGAAAAMFGAGLAVTGAEAARALAVVLWAISGVVACLLTGGVAGPLAVWCLSPLAAVAAFRQPRLLPLGAAAALAAAGAAGLGTLLLPLPAAQAAASPW